MLFNQVARSDHSLKRAAESDFAFLDRCALPPVGKIRTLLELCWANYPEVGRAELASRLRCGDWRHFSSGIFELFLHEYLLRLGFSVKLHPELPNRSAKRPDFLVKVSDTEKFYLEAVCTSDNDGSDRGAEARKNSVLDILDDASHANFVVGVESTGDPTTQPSGKRLAREVVRWLDSLDADRVMTYSAGSYYNLPEYQWKHENWHVHLRAIPLKPAARGLKRKLIGVRADGEACIVDCWSPIRDAVLTKARRYGELDLPLVIAVNLDTFHLDEFDELQALFGQEQYLFNPITENPQPRPKRAMNGAWREPSGQRAKRCSGAWLFERFSAYTLAQSKHTLYLNPWGNHQLPTSFLRMPHALVVDEQIHKVGGVTFKDVFEIYDQ